MKKILLYGYDDLDNTTFQNIAKECNFFLCVISDAVLDKKLEEVFALEEDRIGEHNKFSDQYIIFEDKDSLVMFMNKLAQNDIIYEGIKIILTETNKHWTLEHLFAETDHDHQIMRKAEFLDDLIRQCNIIDFHLLPEEKVSKYKKDLMDAFILLKSGSFSEEELDKSILNILNLLHTSEKIVN